MRLDKEFLELKKQIEKAIKSGEKETAKNYKKTLNDIRNYIAALYAKYEIDGKLTFHEMSKYNRLSKMDKEILGLVSGLYKNNRQVIRNTFKGIADISYTNTSNIISSATGTKLQSILKPIDVTKTINTEMAGLKWTDRVSHHRDTAIYELQKEIKRGLTKGDTYSTMAKRLKKKLETDINKSTQIVRTEGHRVFQQSKKDSLDSASKKVKMTKTWISSRDERVRSQHSEMDKITIPYEEDFIMPDKARGFGPSLIGEPQHDIYCRCDYIIDILDD